MRSGTNFNLLTLLFLTMAFPGLAAAHHSTAIDDSDHPVELAGTVVEWQSVNPHCFIRLEAADS